MSVTIPENLKYAKSHEWVKVEGDVVVVGITEHAVEQMNREIINVELPDSGRTLANEESFAVIDSVKAAFDIYAPVAGQIVEVNDSLISSPEQVSNSPYDEGWIIKISPSNLDDDLARLMTADGYKKMIEEESE
jgi:glycine cleavage system H protein